MRKIANSTKYLERRRPELVDRKDVRVLGSLLFFFITLKPRVE